MKKTHDPGRPHRGRLPIAGLAYKGTYRNKSPNDVTMPAHKRITVV